LLLALLGGAAPAHAADPGRWAHTHTSTTPLYYYQGISNDPSKDFYFDGVHVGLYRTNSTLSEEARNDDVIPPQVHLAEGYNHIGDISWDARENGRVLLPLECYYPQSPNGGNTCPQSLPSGQPSGTGAFGVADDETLKWKYYVKLDPAFITKAMWSELSPDGELIWTSSGNSLLAYDADEVNAQNAIGGLTPKALKPVRTIENARPASGITGAAFYQGRMYVAGQDSADFQVWSIDLDAADPKSTLRLEIERDIVGESEGLTVAPGQLGGVLHWLIQPYNEENVPTYGITNGTILSFTPAGQPEPLAPGADGSTSGPGVSTRSNPWLDRRVLNIAHQGGELEAPSNTLYAYRTALEKGADVLEMDVQLTKDGEIVVFHDRTVGSRTNSENRAVNDMTLAEIQQLDAAADWPEHRGKAPADPEFRIPTLREVLEKYPDELLNIEIKGLAPDSTDPGWQTGQAEEKNQALETAVALAKLLRDYKRDDDVIVVSFSEVALQRFKAEAPEIHTAAGLEAAGAFFGSSAGPAPGATNPEHVALQVPEYFEAGNGAPPVHVVTEDFVDNAHANGLAVHVWLNGNPTENDETYNRLIDLGVDGIMTDRPTKLERNYRDRGIAEDEPRPFHMFSCETQSSGERLCGGTMNSRVRTFDGVPLDVNVALPPKPTSGPDGGFPLVIQLHGWGGSKSGLSGMKSWAARGYAVLSYTARGFGNSCGSPQSRIADPVGCAQGWIRLADSRYEARDSQYLAGLLADQALVDPQRIGAMGGSYGGGQSLHLAVLKDRVRLPDGSYAPWKSEKRGLDMKLAGAVPSIPWSDLAYSLMPNGRTRDYLVDDQLTSRSPIGVMKASYVTGLFATGAAAGYYAPPGADPDADLITWYARVAAGEPYEESVAQNVADKIAYDHSPYHLDMSTAPAPTLISNGWTDDLFPVDEAVRFANKVEKLHPGTPVSQLHFDYGHARGQQKAADMAVLRKRTEDWMDRYVKGDQSVAALDGVEALTETCPKSAASGGPFRADSWHELHPGEVRFQEAAAKTVLAGSGQPEVNRKVDPVAGPAAGADTCVNAGALHGDGMATYELPPATGDGYTLLGSATVLADMEVQGRDAGLVARLWDVGPDGATILVARALYRPDPVGRQVFQLHPNGWHFRPGHHARFELQGEDAPYARPSNDVWSATVSNLELRLPVVEDPCTPDDQVVPPAPPFIPSGMSADALAPGVDENPPDPCATEEPVAPTAGFDLAPAEPVANEPVTFTSSSTDADGEIASEAWDLDGDGQYDDASGPTAQHTFTEPGVHTVGLEVTDDDGLKDAVAHEITVAAPPDEGGGSETGTEIDTGTGTGTGTETGTGTSGDTPSDPGTSTPEPAERGPVDSGTGAATPPAPPAVDLVAPRFASELARGPRVLLALRAAGPADHFQLDVREHGGTTFRRIANVPGTRRTYRFAATAGRTYEFRARAVSSAGVAGPWDRASSIVPFDAFVRLPNYADGWELERTRGAYGGRIARSTREGSALRLSFRGRRLYLIGRRSPQGGQAIALVGRERRVLDFHAARSQERVLIGVWRLRRGGAHELRVANLGRGRVELDAFAVGPG
jgi:glycerophosphoryl diester phosphodiesterase/PKD repeat protein